MGGVRKPGGPQGLKQPIGFFARTPGTLPRPVGFDFLRSHVHDSFKNGKPLKNIEWFAVDAVLVPHVIN